MQCLFDQPLCNTLKRSRRILIFLRSDLPWIIRRQQNDMVFNTLQWPIEKTRRVIWDALHDYGRIEWKRTLMDFGRGRMWPTRTSLKNLIQLGGSKTLLWLGVAYLSRGWINWDGHYLLIPLGCVGSPRLVVFWVFSCNWIFNFCQKIKN